MERLTTKLNDGAYVPNVGLYDITDRLGEYEDTDLTPEQIIELDKLYRQKCEELNREKVRTVELVNTIESLKKVIAATEIQVNKLEHKLRELQKGE